MKTISINLICKTCNNTFTHTKSVKGNGSNYKYWAINHIDKCPRCFAAEKRAERLNWTLQYLSDNYIELPELNGTPNQIKYAKRLRDDFIEKYYLEIVDVINKYNSSKNAFRIEARDRGIEMGQVALQKWSGTRDYYLFASVYIKSASFLINMFLDGGIESVA